MNKKNIFLIFCFVFVWNASLLLFKDGVKVEKNFESLAKSIAHQDTHRLTELISVYNHTNGVVEDMPLEEYIVRVVFAEMPISYGIEALKAQAVAARTYTLYSMNKGRENPHGADVCTDYKHCQAYKSSEEIKEDFNSAKRELVYKAVRETQGEILVYNNQPINAVYHASSHEFTEDAVQVWGSEVPYLVSVATPNENGMSGFYSEISLSFDGFIEKLRYAGYKCDFPDGNVTLQKNKSGRTKYMVIGQINSEDVKVNGTDIRNIFSLKSCTFDISFNGENIVFSVRGYGHGVGMSQYGAKIMAESGKNYREILTHYYKDCKIAEIETYENI